MKKRMTLSLIVINSKHLKTMKKIQAMMAVVLVALMAFAVQSCGSDDKNDLTSQQYKMVISLTIQQRGDMTDADVQKLQSNSTEAIGEYLSDKAAESATDQAAARMEQAIKAEMAGTTSAVKFTFHITTTRVKDGQQICKWDVVYDNGSVSTKKY